MSNELPKEWIEHDKKVKPYLWAHRKIGWTETGLEIILIAAFLFSGAMDHLEFKISAGIQSFYLRWIIFLVVVGGVWRILSFPFSYGSYLVEKRFGLSKQTPGAWFKDQLKGLALGLVLGGIVLSVFYLIASHQTNYWFYMGLFLMFFSVVLAQLAPILLIPLFFKLKPMPDSSLKKRLFDLCNRFKVEVKDIYHLGLGEKTEKGNAAFVGLGKTKRILIGDTLYEKFSEEQVEAIFAHELGHQVHNDIWKGLFLSSGFMLVSFWLAQMLSDTWVFPYFRNTTIVDPSGIFLYFIVLGFVQKPFGLLQTIYSRQREWAADGFASKITQLGQPLSDALEKLTYQNKGCFKPNAFMEFIGHSHPAPYRRILTLRGT